MDLVCKSCKNPVSSTYFFCPYCGSQLRQPPLSISLGKQIGVYFLAIFFPLFSIVPGIRYLGQSDSSSKAIGVVTLLLAGISILLNVYAIIYIGDYFKQLLNNPLSIIGSGLPTDRNLPIDEGKLMDVLKNLQ